MRPILKAEIISYLLSQSTITDLVYDRVYARRIDITRDLPAIVVSKTNESAIQSHSGRGGVNMATYSIFVFARSDREVEAIKQSVNDILDGCDIVTSNVSASLVLLNDADYDDYVSLELDEWAGVLEYECNWAYNV